MYKFKRKVINHKGKVFMPGMVVPGNIPSFAIAEMERVGDIEKVAVVVAPAVKVEQNPVENPVELIDRKPHKKVK
jgi:hypothetical protein